MSTLSMRPLSLRSDLDYIGREMLDSPSDGTVSLGEVCVAERKQVVMLRTPILSVGPAQKVNSWLDQMRTVRMVAEILSSPICTHEVPLWERDHEQMVSHHQSMPQAEQIQSLPRRRDDNSRSSVYDPSDRSDVSEPELNIIGMEGATPLSSAMWSNNEDRTGASVLECTCSHQDGAYSDEVLPAIQLDPRSTLRAASHLHNTGKHKFLPSPTVVIPHEHVWARQLALALDEDDPSEEALDKFAGLNRSERQLVRKGIFDLGVLVHERGDTGVWDGEEDEEDSKGEYFGEANVLLSTTLQDDLETRRRKDMNKTDGEDRVGTSETYIGSPIDYYDSPQTTPRPARMAPRVELRRDSPVCSEQLCGYGRNGGHTTWLCLGTRLLPNETLGQSGRAVQGISIEERLLLVDAAIILGAATVSKTPELYVVPGSQTDTHI